MSDDEREDIEDEEAGSDSAPAEIAAPRENPLLIGHEGAEAALLGAYNSGRLPHAWLLTGPSGIGKATLAFRFARFLFAQAQDAGGLFSAPPQTLALEPSHPMFRRVASGGHADLLVVERGFDAKRKRMRSEIVVDDTRTIGKFLRLTPAEGGWRIVIIDGADSMNRNASNAVLKVLEEPPQQAVLILVSDNPGRLLPTIRSRCRRLSMKPLPGPTLLDALARYRPDLAAADAAPLARLADGSIGRALALASAGGLTLYRNLFNLLGKLPDVEGEALHGFADSLARAGAEDSFALFGELLPGWLARMVTLASGGSDESHEAVLPGEAATMKRLAGRRGLDQWVEVWENLTHLFAQADGINLDRKQVVLNAFFALETAAR